MNTIQFRKVRILISFLITLFLVIVAIKTYGESFQNFIDRSIRVASNSNNDFKQLTNNPKLEASKRNEPEVPKASDHEQVEYSGKKRPGDNGEPVLLSDEEQKKAKEMWALNEFNMIAAAKVPLDRTLPDFRHELCKKEVFDLTSLPSTSIIVIFHNEEFYTLLRTATSCYNRSPSSVLKEIILVDDFSDRDHLKSPLESYINEHFNGKVKLVRTPSRHGLIRAKNFGSRHATGDALVFLDSHCECTAGWLPPLLQALKDNPKTVVQPVIPGMDPNTLAFQYSDRSLSSQGTFQWSLLFYWRDIPPHDQALRKSEIDRIRSPTLAGGLFGLMREWWEYLGRYDDGMELWGGENLELSFKSWLCGGGVEYIPCSHVGHIYRGKHPYKWYKPGPDRAFTVNARRLAEVWLDEYKRFFYEIAPDAKHLDMGDISEQLANKKRLNCKPFEYFLTDVMKDWYPPTLRNWAEGSLRPASDKTQCIDTMNKEEGEIGLFGCHNQGGNQAVSFSETGEIRLHVSLCLANNMGSSAIVMEKCKGSENQRWRHESSEKQLINKLTGQCLSHENQKLVAQLCSDSSPEQRWIFGVYFDQPQ